MRFRLGLAIGFGAGYVLGAQAGRERYEEIVSTVQRWRGTEPVQEFESTVRDVASTVTEQVQTAASEKAGQVADKARDLVDSGGDGAGNGTQPAAQGGYGSS